jgi:hypothetical protein
VIIQHGKNFEGLKRGRPVVDLVTLVREKVFGMEYVAETLLAEVDKVMAPAAYRQPQAGLRGGSTRVARKHEQAC